MLPRPCQGWISICPLSTKNLLARDSLDPPAGPGWGWGCAGLEERGSEFLATSCFNWEASLSRRAGSLGTTTQGGECLAPKREITEDKK